MRSKQSVSNQCEVRERRVVIEMVFDTARLPADCAADHARKSVALEKRIVGELVTSSVGQ